MNDDHSVRLFGGPRHGEHWRVRGDRMDVVTDSHCASEFVALNEPVEFHRVTYKPSGWERKGVEMWTINGDEPWVASVAK